MSLSAPVLGLVLAGGRASRMGGGNKAMKILSNRPLLDWVTERLEPQCESLLISSATESEPSAHLVIKDNFPDFQGPLAGIEAGLQWLMRERPAISWLLSAPVDCPFLPGNLASRLQEACANQGAPCAMAASGGHGHPTIALWHVSLLADLQMVLKQGQMRKLGSFLSSHNVVQVEWPVTPFDPFFNINRPEDLSKAESLAADICLFMRQ